jgi:xanthine/uracil permease
MYSTRIYCPDDPIPFSRLVAVGMQHVIAMSGATVPAPLPGKPKEA